MKCFVGFDGYRDELYQVVRKREGGETFLWPSIEGFGAYVASLAGKNGDMELVPLEVGLGGNGPRLAKALGSLGVSTGCIGLFEGCQDLMGQLAGKAAWASIGPCNQCMGLEFQDGKLMFGRLSGWELTWRHILDQVGLKRLVQLAGDCQLACLVNWSAFLHMNQIIGQMEAQVWKGRPRILFFDLADLSARSQEDARELFDLLGFLSKRHQVVLGLNEKELGLFAEKCFGSSLEGEEKGWRLAAGLGQGMVVVHNRKGARCYAGRHRWEEEAGPIPNPKILTGAGDHFNAGFCWALLQGKGPGEALSLGNQAAGYYICHGTDMEGDKDGNLLA